MERLCKVYKNPCTLGYRRAWTKVERSSSCIPHVADLLLRLLCLNCPEHPRQSNDIRTSDRAKRTRDLAAASINIKKDMSPGDSRNLEPKQSSSKGILTSVLTRIRFKGSTDGKTIYEEKTDPTWTVREQDLAWKYFYRWYNAVLKSKVPPKGEERPKDMDPRMKHVLEVVTWLTDCQKRAQGYEFPVHSFTKEFLLKTRYREDRENFFISLKVEPSMVT